MVFIFGDPGTASPIMCCEQGARLRGLDLEIAAADAKYWWETGLVPLRATPLAWEERQQQEDLVDFNHDRMDEKNWYNQRKAAEEFGKKGDEESIKSLTEMLKDEDWRIRWEAVNALEKIGDKRVIELLKQALKDDERHVRYKAEEAIEKIEKSK